MDAASRNIRHNPAVLPSTGSATKARAGGVQRVMRDAGLSLDRLATLPFDEAAELLSQAQVGAGLSDDQAIDLVGFLLSSRSHG